MTRRGYIITYEENKELYPFHNDEGVCCHCWEEDIYGRRYNEYTFCPGSKSENKEKEVKDCLKHWLNRWKRRKKI